jgi:hypothetical protein
VSASSRRGCAFKNYDELNASLLDQCIAYAEAHHQVPTDSTRCRHRSPAIGNKPRPFHPELTDQTIWDVFEAFSVRTSESPWRCGLRQDGRFFYFGWLIAVVR